ncbi:hypothetical protein [Halosimplex halobium]|uniref:hypothetical protein n=1 Tax=Halosimplex halobium TaxID=3396618 RepID=UPI003F575F5D
MSLRDRPSRGSSTGRTGRAPLTRALALVQEHVRTWPRRYVEMRTAALRDR